MKINDILWDNPQEINLFASQFAKAYVTDWTYVIYKIGFIGLSKPISFICTGVKLFQDLKDGDL